MLLTFRISARRRVRGVIDDSIGDEGGVVEVIEVVSLLQMNLDNDRFIISIRYENNNNKKSDCKIVIASKTFTDDSK